MGKRASLTMGRVLRAVLAACLFALCSGQMSMSADEEAMLEEMGVSGQPMGRKNQEPQAEALKGDLKYIYCGVCRKMVEVAYTKSNELLEKRFKHKKKHKHEVVEYDGEGAVQEFVEKMCLPLKPEGEWVAKIDLVQVRLRVLRCRGGALLSESHHACTRMARQRHEVTPTARICQVCHAGGNRKGRSCCLQRSRRRVIAGESAVQLSRLATTCLTRPTPISPRFCTTV